MNNEIAGLIKKMAVDAVNAGKPADAVFGVVISEQPLRIQTDQKLVLEEECLILCRAVTEHSADISISSETDESVGYSFVHSHTYGGETELSGSDLLPAHSHGYSGRTGTWGFEVPAHSHDISGRKKLIFHLGLKTGESVIMLRLCGGQKFVVLDRAEAPNTSGEWKESV